MSGNLYQLLNVDRRNAISNPLAPSIGGFVFVLDHFYEFEGYWFFSVNHQSCSGTGWQSERIYRREDADMIASVLCNFLDAELCE